MTPAEAGDGVAAAETPSTPPPRSRPRPTTEAYERTHQKGRPSPRCSPKRVRRAIEYSASVVAIAAAMLFPRPGSDAERMLPKSRVVRVLKALPIPNHLRGTLSVITDSANAETCQCLWLSYDGAAPVVVLERRQVITNVAGLEGLDVIETRTRAKPLVGNLPNDWTVKVPDRLHELARAYAATSMADELDSFDKLERELEEAERERERAEGGRDASPSFLDEEGAEEPADDDAGDVPPEIASTPPAAPAPAPVAAPAPPVELRAPEPAEARDIAQPPPGSSLQPMGAWRPLSPLARGEAPPPRRPDFAGASPPPVDRTDAAAGAILELVLERSAVFQHLAEEPATFAVRLARDLVRDGDVPLVQVLVGLFECSTKPGRKGAELASFAVSCIQHVRSTSSPPKPVRKILRRATDGLTVASLPASSRGPPPA